MTQTLKEKQVNAPAKKKRLTNFELLRILSMVMIVTLHYLGKGCVLYTDNTKWPYYFGWIFESLCFVAVNCYVLLSGYFITENSFKAKKLISLWLQVFATGLFCCAVTLLPQVKAGAIDKKILLKTFLPVISSEYWYISAYFVFYLISPFLCRAASMINQRRHKILNCSLIVIFAFFGFINDFTNIKSGYSFLWFVVLFFVASYIRKYDSYNKKPIFYYSMYVLFALVNLLCNLGYDRIIIEKLKIPTSGADIFFSYNCILVFLSSLFLFLAFKNTEIKNRFFCAVINFLSPLTLGVYLIHEHPAIINEWLWVKVLSPLPYLDSPVRLFLHLICSVGIVYIVCSLIEFVRTKIFALFGINKLSDFLGRIAEKGAKKVFNNKTVNKL